MKTHFIPLLLAAIVIFSSMSDCDKVNYYEVNSPAQASINGILCKNDAYYIPPQNFLGGRERPNKFLQKKDVFNMHFERELSNEEHDCSYTICISLTARRPLEFGKKYMTGDDSTISLEFVIYGSDYRRIVTDSGWIEITDSEHVRADGDLHFLSGKFECSGGNEDSEYVEVLDGYFIRDVFDCR